MSFYFLTNARWTRFLTIGFCLIAVVLGASQTWTTRFAMNTDGVQYLDNARAYWSGDFARAINSQWSPLYPWLIGAWFAALRPGPYLEFPLVHALNFLIYLFSIAGFLFFVDAVGKTIPASKRAPAIHISLLLIAYSSFLYCSLDLTSLAYVTPDLLVSFFTFLAAGLLLRLASGSAAGSHYLALGAVLGLGYLAKTPFLVFGLLCLGMAVVLVRKHSSPFRVWLTAVVFAAIAIPYIWILSNSKSRFTIGDSGRWNIIWMVNRVQLYNWQGGPAGNGVPIHPTRQLASDPDIFEFASPIGGTYPPWYDPIYWTEGAKIAIRPADFARALGQQIQLYVYLIHHRQLPLIFALAALLLLASGKRRLIAGMIPYWPVLLLGAAPFAMYAIVHAEGRYLAPFFVLLWTGLAAGLLIGLDDTLDARVMLSIAAVAAALMLVEAATATPPAMPARLHYEVAERVQTLGLKRDDQVAMVSGDFDYFWARLAGARVTMQIDFDGPSCPDCRRHQAGWEKAKPILSAHGVVMVVSPCVPGVVDQPGWQQLGATGVYAYRFH